MEPDDSINVLGAPLGLCGLDPVTGFFRDGHCNTCVQDQGSHTVCAVMTAEFLAFSKYVGNDLSTPRPQFGFDGLKDGDGCFLRVHKKAYGVWGQGNIAGPIRHFYWNAITVEVWVKSVCNLVHY